MKLEPECVGCLLNQVLKAFKLLEIETSRDLIIKTQKGVMQFLLKQDLDKISAPIVGKFLYSKIGELIQVQDPYKELKTEYNELALYYYDEIKKFVFKQEDPIFEAIVVSALGNTIDFASQHKIDLVNDLKTFTPDDLVINDYTDFMDSLKKKKKLLILGDNCGEIVFDKIMIEVLKNRYPELEIIYAVRSKPIINDATMEDARKINLTSLVTVIESSGAPGIDLNDITPEFKRYFYSKDYVILSKGQGNFETLNDVDIPNQDLFYLLKAKCILMKRIFKVPVGSLIFKMRA
ncbi:MAG: DUF89 family protein [Candidatus Lokiarchaeota archaeon]|nr:DUF89 family protein [Candidatus Lokiarchaeota archaeon]MBD3199707.1 DUF89 family protein [Candidatus Lokiarchaeota archaeon]